MYLEVKDSSLPFPRNSHSEGFCVCLSNFSQSSYFAEARFSSRPQAHGPHQEAGSHPSPNISTAFTILAQGFLHFMEAVKKAASFLVSILSVWLQSTKPRGSYSVKALSSLVTHLASGLSLTSSDWGVWFGHRNSEGQGHMHTEGDFYTGDEVSLMPNYTHFYFQS